MKYPQPGRDVSKEMLAVQLSIQIELRCVYDWLSVIVWWLCDTLARGVPSLKATEAGDPTEGVAFENGWY